MANSDSQDVVESSNPDSNTSRSVPPTFSSFFRPRMVFAVLGVVLVIGVVSIMSKSEAPAVVPYLIGERVDPQLDSSKDNQAVSCSRIELDPSMAQWGGAIPLTIHAPV
jgi:hypothetical protein